MMDFLRRDSYAVGVIMGLVIPVVLFGVIYGIFALIMHANPQMLVNSPNL